MYLIYIFIYIYIYTLYNIYIYIYIYIYTHYIYTRYIYLYIFISIYIYIYTHIVYFKLQPEALSAKLAINGVSVWGLSAWARVKVQWFNGMYDSLLGQLVLKVLGALEVHKSKYIQSKMFQFRKCFS